MTSPSAPVVRDVPRVGDVWRLQWGFRNQWIDWKWMPDGSYACVAAGSEDGHQPGYRTKSVVNFGCGERWSLIHRAMCLPDAEKPVEARAVRCAWHKRVNGEERRCSKTIHSGDVACNFGETKPVEAPKPPKCEECGEPGDFPVRIFGKRQLRVRKCDDCYLANEAGALPGIMDGHNAEFVDRHKEALKDRLKGSTWSPVDYGPTARVVLARGGRR